MVFSTSVRLLVKDLQYKRPSREHNPRTVWGDVLEKEELLPTKDNYLCFLSTMSFFVVCKDNFFVALLHAA